MDFQSKKSFGKLRLRAFLIYYQILCMLKHVEDVEDRNRNRICTFNHMINRRCEWTNRQAVWGVWFLTVCKPAPLFLSQTHSRKATPIQQTLAYHPMHLLLLMVLLPVLDFFELSIFLYFLAGGYQLVSYVPGHGAGTTFSPYSSNNHQMWHVEGFSNVPCSSEVENIFFSEYGIFLISSYISLELVSCKYKGWLLLYLHPGWTTWRSAPYHPMIPHWGNPKW